MTRTAANGAPPEPEPGPESGGPAEIVETLLGLLSILRRRWLTVAIMTALAIAAGAFVSMLLRPQWESRATLVLNPTGPQVLDTVKSVNDEEQWGYATYKQYYETQRAIIGSRKIASMVLDKLPLADDPVFLGVDRIASEPERLARIQSIDPITQLQELVSVGEVRNSRVVRISARYPEPEMARDIVNEILDAYLEYVRIDRSDTGETAKVNVEAEREKALRQLREAERALDAFKEEHEITSISLADRQNLITQNITTLNERSKAAMATRVELQSTYEQIERLRDVGSLAAASMLAADDRGSLAALMAERLEATRELKDAEVKYLAKHPSFVKAKQRLEHVNRRIVDERGQLLESVGARLYAAKSTEKELAAALERERKQALKLGRLEPNYREMEREVTTSDHAYAVVARRDTEIGMTNRVESPRARVLDLATASARPVFPNKPLVLALAAIFGLILGSLLAIAVDLRDPRIRDLLDLERSLAGFGLPVLGQLPLLPVDPQLGAGNIRAQRRQRDLYAHLFPQSLMAERCRGLRTSLTFSLSTDGPIILMVTSPGSEEGKSSTAMNLAMSYCQADKKVALVDADMRRPRLHEVFPPPVGQETLGLSGVLKGTVDIDDALRIPGGKAPDNLTILPCGELPDNPAELLDLPACRKTLAALRDRFDVVIIDSPPLLPVTDPLLLARQVDGVVILAKCGFTTAQDLERALGALRHRDTNLLGVVLNEIDPRGSSYGASSKYYYYHSRQTAPESV